MLEIGGVRAAAAGLEPAGCAESALVEQADKYSFDAVSARC
jgi:hypothetical protein